MFMVLLSVVNSINMSTFEATGEFGTYGRSATGRGMCSAC